MPLFQSVFCVNVLQESQETERTFRFVAFNGEKRCFISVFATVLLFIFKKYFSKAPNLVHRDYSKHTHRHPYIQLYMLNIIYNQLTTDNKQGLAVERDGTMDYDFQVG